MTNYKSIKVYIDPRIVRLARGEKFETKRASLSPLERFLIFIGLKREPKRIITGIKKYESLMDLIPRVKAPKFIAGRIGDIT